MNSKLTTGLFLAAASVLATLPAHATPIIYSINRTSTTPAVAGELSPLSDTVLGTITTNGTLGALQQSDILDWNLQLIDNIRPQLSFTLTPANSAIWYFSNLGLTATPTDLIFDFNAAGAGFLIQGNVTHALSSGYNYFCYQATTGACLQGETIVPDYYAVNSVLVTNLTGALPLNSPVPEPAAWALMMAGLGAVGAALRRRRSIIAFA